MRGVKRIAALLLALIAVLLPLMHASLADASPVDASTDVKFKNTGLQIISRTEDHALDVGATLSLQVQAEGLAPLTYVWERSTNGGAEYTVLTGETTSALTVTNPQENTPESQPYLYRVTVSDAGGYSDSVVMSVLVHDGYAYRTISPRNGNVQVSAYMHADTRVTLTPLNEGDASRTRLEGALDPNGLPLIVLNASLTNPDADLSPYTGPVTLSFDVGGTLNGDTLRVHRLVNNAVETYEDTVSGGMLTITVDHVETPFLVEAPSTSLHTITASAEANGSISPVGSINTADGSDRTFIFLPNEGYRIDSVLVNGTEVAFTGNSYTIQNVTADASIVVRFEQVPASAVLHGVEITAGARGIASPSGMLHVRHGQAQTIQLYPERGYEVDEVYVNGVLTNIVGETLLLSAVTADTTVRITFRAAAHAQPPRTYHSVLVSAGVNGAASPAGEIRVEHGGDTYICFVPDDGYELDQVTLDGAPVTVVNNTLHVIPVLGERTVHATFKVSVTPPIIYHTITTSAGANGTIDPSGTIQVADGGAQSFYFIPDHGFSVDEVWIDGVKHTTSADRYTITDVRAAHTIRVTFARTVTPPTGEETNRKLVWSLLICVCVLLICVCVIMLQWLKKREEDG